MKTRTPVTSPARIRRGRTISLAAAAAAVLAGHSAMAATLYWDTNGATAGSGAATGTWGTSTFWSTNAAGTIAPTVTATTSVDDLFIAAGTVGTGGTITVNGAVLANGITFDDPVNVTISGGTSITLGGGAAAGTGIFQTAAGSNVISTAVILGASSTAFSLSDTTTTLLTIGAITGAATSGTQTLNANSTNTGGITINGIIGNGGGGGVVALSVNNSGAGVTALTAANTYTGNTTITAGALNLGNGTATGSLSASSTLVIGGSTGTFTYSRTGTNTQVLNGLNVTGGFSKVNNTVATNTLTLGAITRSGSGMLDFATLAGNINTSTANDATGIIGQWAFAGQTTTLGYAVANGAGSPITTLTGTAAAAGNISNVTSATTNFDYDGNSGDIGQVGAISGNTLRITGGGIANWTNSGFGIALNGLMLGGSTNVVQSGAGVITIGTGTNTELDIVTNGQTLTLGSVIADNGAGASSLVVGSSNGGAVILSAANTFTGAATVFSTGALRLAHVNALQNSTVTIGAPNGLAFSTNIGRFNVGALAGASSQTLTDTAGVSVILVAGGSGSNSTYSGVLGGTGSLIKTGAGTLTLSGASTFTGGITISAGTVLTTTSALALGTGPGPVVVAGGANLTFGTANLTYAQNIAGAGTINASTLGTGSNSLGFSGNLAGFTGTLNVGTGGGRVRFQTASGNQIGSSAVINVLNGGTLLADNVLTYGNTVFLNGGTTGEALGQLRLEIANWAGSVVLNANTTIGGNINGVNSIATISGVISGAGFGFTRLGTGTTVLTNANTYTGTTGINAGFLQLGNGGTTGSLATGSAIVMTSPGILAINRSNAVAQGTDFTATALSGNGGIEQRGTGTTTLSSANIYTGTTTVSRGTLNLDFSAAGAPAINIINNVANTSALFLAHGTLTLTGKASTINSQRFNGLTLNPGASNILINADPTLNPLLLDLGALTHNIGGTVDFTLPIGTQNSTNGAVTSTVNTNGILGGYITVGGTDWAANATNAAGGNIVGYSTVGAYTLSSAAGNTAANYLNLNIGVDSSQTPAAAITPNSLRFNTAGANTLTLTGTNVITTGGIMVNSPVGSNLSTITGGTLQGANTKDLVIIQNNTGGGLTIGSIIANNTGATGLTKSGNGALTLTGVNLYTGNTVLNGGTLNINNSSAIGNTAVGALVINGGTLDNTSAGAIITTAAKAQNWNGDFTFTGTQSLNFTAGTVGTGAAATIGGPSGTRTVTINAGTLAITHIVSGSGYNFTKAGAGTLTLTSTTNHSVTGVLNVAGGKIQVAADMTVGGLAGSGTIENGGGAGKWFFAGNAGGDSTFSGTIQDGPTAGVRLGFVKQGGGTLTLSGTNTPGDAFRVEAGTVNITGTTNVGIAATGTGQILVGNVSNQLAQVNVNGGALNAISSATFAIGASANSRAVVRLNSGSISTVGQFNIGNGNGALGTNPYAAFTMSGGTLSSGSWLVVGANNDRAVLNQSGGAITVVTNRMTIGAGGNGSVGVVNLSGGTFTNNGGIFLGENGTGILTLSGTADMTLGPTGTMQFAGNGTSLAGSLNLRGGTLSANSITKGASTATGVYRFNFDGGTLKATATNAGFFANLAQTTASVYAGGANIHSNGFDIAIDAPLIAPTAGNGVNSIASFTPGAGYVDTPVVTVFGDGVGATAVANVSGGVFTGITITNPGVGYTTAPTFQVYGGGATIPATITGAAPTANTSGGLTKSGAGALTLNGNSSYTGATLVSAGTLVMGAAGGSINSSSSININGAGAKMVQNSFATVTPAVTLTNGTIDGTGTYDNVTVISGAGNVVANGNGTTAPVYFNTLSFNNAATVNLNLASQSPVLFATTLNTGVVNAAGLITINATSASWLPGQYDLISYGTLGGVGFSEFIKGTITGLSGRQTATLINPAGFVSLTIGGDNPVWTGYVSGNWTTNVITPNGFGDKNWKLIAGGTPTDFLTNDVVFFDDTAGGTTAVSINDANVSPLSTNFNNAGLAYTLSSTGAFGIAAGSVSITGGGIVTINNANTYAGGTTVTSGTLNINNAAAIGTGALNIAANTFIDNSSGVPVTLSANNVQNWNGDFFFGGTNSLNLGTGAVALPATRNVSTNGTGTLTVGGVISGVGFGLTKSGSSTMVLSGASTYTGATIVSAGTLILTGSINAGNTANVGQVSVGTATDDAVLRVNGGTLNATKTAVPSISVGASTFGNGAMYLTSGTVNATSELWMGNAAGVYGSFTMDLGTANVGSWLAAGRSGNGLLKVNGGTLTVSTNNIVAASFLGASGELTFTGGITNVTNTGAAQGRLIAGESGSGVLNVSGTAVVNVSGPSGVFLGIFGTGVGIANLRGGTVTAPMVQKGTGTGILNFDGGTLKASTNAATFVNGLTNAYIYGGGATIDSGTFAVTVGQPLLAPTGNGVSATGLSISGSGYIGAPLVQISGDGFGATARANVDSLGNLTGIVITNPGVGYTVAPTFTLVGGGLSNTGSITGSATLVANAGGGLTKVGNGSLTLTGTNTYSGATLVSAGTLTLSGTADINGSSGITVNGAGAKLVQATTVAGTPTVTLTNGTIDGTGTLGGATVASSAGNIIANGNGTTGALTINNLTFNDAATLNLNVGSTSPVIVTTTLTTGAINAAGLITVNAGNVSWANGSVYNLISYSGAMGGIGFGEFIKGTITGLGIRQSATLTNPTGFVALSVAGDSPVWTGLNSGNWTTNVIPPGKNWKLITGGGSTDFLATDAVLFDDTATGVLAVSISTANVSPTTTVFNNAANTYTISSGGGFGIATGNVVKGGAGTVTISTDNTYTGGTTVNAGTLDMTGNNNFGTGFVTVAGGTGNFNGNNTYSGGTTASGGALVMMGNNSFGTGGVTVSGGILTLSGNNTYSGLTTVSNGTLNVNNSGALGSAALVMTGGALANTSGADIVMGVAKAQNWNGNFSFNGPNNLDFNLGAVTVGGVAGSRTVTVNSGTMSVGLITAPAGYGLTKAGAGNLAMTNTANTTNIAGDLNITGGKFQTYGDVTMGGLTGSGTIENGGAASKWIFVQNAVDNTFSGTIQDNPNNAAVRLGLVKRGVGTLNLTGVSNIYTDRFAVENGTVRMTGTNTTGFGAGANQSALIGSIANQNGVLIVDGGTLNAARTAAPSVSAGTISGGSGAIIVKAGGSISASSEIWVGTATGGYGSFTMNSDAGSVTSASWLPVGRNGNGVLNVNGGTLNVIAQNFSLGSFGGATGVMTLTGGTTSATATAAGQGKVIVGEGGTGVLTVSGTAALNAAGPVGIELARTGTGVVNLNGGTVTTTSVGKGTGTGILNFNGGKLKASADNATFLQGLTSAYVYSGGGMIDDGGFNITVAQSFLAPTGSGVTATGLTVSGGGYIGAPLVQVGGDGVGATAIATIDGTGTLTGITVTNPGVGYTTSSFTLVGGGFGNTGAVGGTATLAANTSGTLTKVGNGTLTLTGTQGYNALTTSAGTTNVNTSFTGGTATVNANATTNFNASQTLGALNIGAGAVVTFGSGVPFAAVGADGKDSSPSFASGGSVIVPEPGSLALLIVGALGVLGRRRRQA